MDKVSFVTLWVEPTERQILKYEFQNIDADFLPARWMLRLDELHASMRMGNPFPGVWLPASLGIRVDMTVAVGRLSAIFDTTYRDYRLAETDSRVIIEQAIGILAERFDLPTPDAFEVLRSAARNSRREVKAVAEEVRASRETPHLSRPRLGAREWPWLPAPGRPSGPVGGVALGERGALGA